MASLSKKLSQCNVFWFSLYATCAAFCTYFSMYAFRKPFTVASYESVDGWSFLLDFKTAIVLSQVIGYALSKFIGIKVVSELSGNRRAYGILALVMMAELALILFALVPLQYKLLMLFLNGLPLGMIWGLVFSFLEGRRVSEVLGAGLSISFIVSSGVVKSVGKWLMLDMGISEFWMPAVTGLLFTPMLFVSVYFLSCIPRPTPEDVAERHARLPMTAEDRWHLLKKYFPGLLALVVVYVMLTALRDYSDNFANEIWTLLGYGDQPGIFSTAALITSLVILALLSLVMLVKNNLNALMVNHGFILVGIAVIGVSTFYFNSGALSGDAWMILHSTGIYLAYIPFNCLLFDRFLSVVDDKANAGFLIYIADAMGYAGSVGILVYKSLFDVQLSWIDFLVNCSYLISLVGSILIVGAMLYFYRTLSRKRAPLAHAGSLTVE